MDKVIVKVNQLFQTVDSLLERVLLWLLVGAVFLILFCTLGTILLRWFGQSLVWLEPLARHVVFLSVFLGGALATGADKHISIDAFERFALVKFPRFLIYLRGTISFLSCFIVLWLLYSSLEVVRLEYEFGKVAFLGITTGTLISIIPVGFGIIAFRFFVRGVFHLDSLMRRGSHV